MTLVVITDMKQRRPRKDQSSSSSSRSPKKKGKGKNPWETDSEEEEVLSSGDDSAPRPAPRATSRRTAGVASQIKHDYNLNSDTSLWFVCFLFICCSLFVVLVFSCFFVCLSVSYVCVCCSHT